MTRIKDGYKDTEIGVIPNEWNVAKLETICDVRDGTHDSPKYQESGIPFITSKHLTDNGVDFSDVNYISNEDHISFSKRSLVENGDILFGMIGTIGKPLIVNYDFEFSIKNVALLKFKDNTQLNNSFTLNLLKSTIIDKQFSKLSNGGVQSFIALGMIRSLKIPLPPLKEQEKIADILSTADDKIDVIASQIEKTQTLKKGLLQKLLSEGIGHSKFKDSELGKIPDSWGIDTINSVSQKINVGFVGTCEKFYTDKANGVLMIRTGNVKEGKIDLSNLKHISYEFHNKNTKSQLKINDLLIARHGSSGLCSIVPEDFPEANCLNIVMIRIDTKKSNPIFTMYLFNSNIVQIQMEQKKAGSTQGVVNTKEIAKTMIVIPPLEEQKQIADILSTADEKLEVLRAKKEKYETLKKGLLQKLLSGEVRV
ncbi:MAG: restriction endonuclease subunit S [Campylobacterota bacterium]|nr:restriction endonuclease subunit S [Campylobacterota bacterium]